MSIAFNLVQLETRRTNVAGIEEQLERLNKNLEALIKAGGVTAAATPEGGKPGRKPKGPTLDAVKAMAEKMAEATDKAAVRKLLQKVGKVKTTAELDAKHYAAFITQAEAAIKEADNDDDDDDDNDDDDDDDDDD